MNLINKRNKLSHDLDEMICKMDLGNSEHLTILAAFIRRIEDVKRMVVRHGETSIEIYDEKKFWEIIRKASYGE